VLRFVAATVTAFATVGAACACSCVAQTVSDALEHIERADVVFHGYILDVDYGEIGDCQPTENSSRELIPTVSIKVVDALKGTSDGEIVEAFLPEAQPIVISKNCDVFFSGNSCQYSLGGPIVTDPRSELDHDVWFSDLERHDPEWAQSLNERWANDYDYRWFALDRFFGILIGGQPCAPLSYQAAMPLEQIELAVQEFRNQ